MKKIMSHCNWSSKLEMVEAVGVAAASKGRRGFTTSCSTIPFPSTMFKTLWLRFLNLNSTEAAHSLQSLEKL